MTERRRFSNRAASGARRRLCPPNPVSRTRADGAARETREEALAAVDILAPYVHFDIPRIDQVACVADVMCPFAFGQHRACLMHYIVLDQQLWWRVLAVLAV